MLTRGYLLGEIVDSFTDLAAQTSMRGKLGLTDLNTFAEDFFKTTLNHIYGYSLTNLNSERSNAPGLDLGDPFNQVAYQITATRTSEKVVKTIEKLSPDQIKSYPTVYVLIIGHRQSSYTLGGDVYLANAATLGFTDDVAP